MNSYLGSFIKFLDDNKLIEFSMLKQDTEDGFNNRLKAQKYVYLAQNNFELDLGYEFTKYKFGPYSPQLTEDYFGINFYENQDENNDLYNLVVSTEEDFNFGILPLPETFNKNGFLEIVSGKDVSWLEVATTILHKSKWYDKCGKLLDMVSLSKPKYNRGYIKQVLDELTLKELMACQ